jgi:regulator of sigma E protease
MLKQVQHDTKMILTVIVFLIILSILVIVHEFGHFIVGKINGIKIEEFALGLPFTKPIFSKKFPDGMKLSLYPLLFGGFVKLLGEEKDEKSRNSFSQKNVWQRIAVVVAGVAMNLILATFALYLFSAFRF